MFARWNLAGRAARRIADEPGDNSRCFGPSECDRTIFQLKANAAMKCFSQGGEHSEHDLKQIISLVTKWCSSESGICRESRSVNGCSGASTIWVLRIGVSVCCSRPGVISQAVNKQTSIFCNPSRTESNCNKLEYSEGRNSFIYKILDPRNGTSGPEALKAAGEAMDLLDLLECIEIWGQQFGVIPVFLPIT